MMREIKFRVFTKEYGIKKVNEINYGSDESIALIGSDGIGLLTRYGTGKEAIIEQYTGIRDINGVEIYEGDVILAKGIEYEVEWFNTSFWAIPYSGVGSSQPISNLYEYDGKNIEKIRVIGNIHEDKELLQ